MQAADTCLPGAPGASKEAGLWIVGREGERVGELGVFLGEEELGQGGDRRE